MHSATPMLTEMRSTAGKSTKASFPRTRSANIADLSTAWCWGTTPQIPLHPNGSIWSAARSKVLTTSASLINTRSPTAWPYWSLTTLNQSISITNKAQRVSVALQAGHFIGDRFLNVTSVPGAGQFVGAGQTLQLLHVFLQFLVGLLQ